MIDWATIKPLIKAQVSELSGVIDSAVRWVDEPSGPMDGFDLVIYLRISAVSGVGREEERYESNGANDQTVTVVGQREFTLSIRCESFTQDITDPRHAMNVVERVKTRFHRTSAVQDRLGAFAVGTNLGNTWFSFIDAGGRPIDTYIADFRCLTSDADEDLTPDAGAWIGEVVTNGTVTSGSDTDTIQLDVKP